MAKSWTGGEKGGRRAADRRRAAHEQESAMPEALPATADDRASTALGAPATRPAPTREEIARRAFEIYIARGRTHGSDVEDWLKAERELRGR